MNRLADETSPYLRQHADNPVDWWPWAPEAFARARLEDKPVFLSVGYSACHWCHVMAHESFEDPDTAAVMNELFVNVKVDREERPDVDAVYMDATQAMTGQGGWPMTVFCTPEGEPFFTRHLLPEASGATGCRRSSTSAGPSPTPGATGGTTSSTQAERGHQGGRPLGCPWPGRRRRAPPSSPDADAVDARDRPAAGPARRRLGRLRRAAEVPAVDEHRRAAAGPRP